MLFDNWPGVPDGSPPQDGFDGAIDHNVAVATHKVGRKIQVYDETAKGYSTFIYLKNNSGAEVAIGAIGLFQCTLGEVKSDDAVGTYLKNGIIGIAVGAIADGYYGFWWCGGVCVRQAKYGCLELYKTVIPNDLAIASHDVLMCADDNPGVMLDTWAGDLVPCGVALATTTT